MFPPIRKLLQGGGDMEKAENKWILEKRIWPQQTALSTIIYHKIILSSVTQVSYFTAKMDMTQTDSLVT